MSADALVDDIEEAITLEGGPDILDDGAFDAEWAELDSYPSLVLLPSVSVVIPTLNEEANIGWVLQRMPAWVEEVIVVDGGSIDRTVEVARALRSDVVVVTELRKGKGAALRAGFAAATREVIVMIDADGSMDPAEIETYVRAIDEGGYDLVKGSRACPGGSSTDLTIARQLGNFFLRSLVNVLYAADFSELCYGFMALRRTSVPAMELISDGFEIETEIVVNSLRRGLRIAEVPSHEAERLNGESHLHPVRDGLRVLSTLLRARFTRLSPQVGSARPSLAQDSVV
jgi:glycosyltransferase involved in cell wall biosynthesis